MKPFDSLVNEKAVLSRQCEGLDFHDGLGPQILDLQPLDFSFF